MKETRWFSPPASDDNLLWWRSAGSLGRWADSGERTESLGVRNTRRRFHGVDYRLGWIRLARQIVFGDCILAVRVGLQLPGELRARAEQSAINGDLTML